MGFLSYNLQYYDTALQAFENSSPTAERVYLAKQLLKFAEDIADEGYTALSDTLESTYNGITRLKNYILSNGEKTFPLFASQNSAPSYAKEKIAFCGLDKKHRRKFEIMFSGKGIPFDFFEGLEDAKIWLLT